MLNKRGYVMVYALGVIALLMLLTASLTNITMTRSNIINKQVYYIQEASIAKSQVEAAASELSTYFYGYENVDNKYLYELNADFASYIFQDVASRYHVIIRDLTVDSCVYPTDPNKDPCYQLNPDLATHALTYAYDIVYSGKYLVAQKRFYLSMIPSFLYFALGSKTDMTINGGAYVYGDMYVNNNLYLTDTANYKINSALYNQQTSFMTVNPVTSLYLAKSVNSCNNTSATCYDLSTNEYLKNPNAFTTVSSDKYSTTFVETPPKVKTFTDRFLNVDFDNSFIYYINDAINIKNQTYDFR